MVLDRPRESMLLFRCGYRRKHRRPHYVHGPQRAPHTTASSRRVPLETARRLVVDGRWLPLAAPLCLRRHPLEELSTSSAQRPEPGRQKLVIKIAAEIRQKPSGFRRGAHRPPAASGASGAGQLASTSRIAAPSGISAASAPAAAISIAGFHDQRAVILACKISGLTQL